MKIFTLTGCLLLLLFSKPSTAQLTEIATDFDGYWFSRIGTPNATTINDSHNLLAFTYNGITYSTGANDAILNSKGLPYTAGKFRALPVAGIAGTNSGSGATYLALARKVDGSFSVGNVTGVAGFSVKSVLTDGINGLNLGTGVTNLPTSAILTFSVFNINPSKISDNEPDIIITQIAQPVAGNDVFTFIDANGNNVGSPVTQDMTQLSRFGTYDLDLFNLTPNTPWNNATAYSLSSQNTNREIRMVAFRLSDFGITNTNVSQVRALKVTPSGNSDYAFIAYNENAINIPPNISLNLPASNTNICAGGIASLSVIGTAAAGGVLSYSWQRSVDGGLNWTTVSEGGAYSGANSSTLSVQAPNNGEKFRAIVYESGNPNSSTSDNFTISVGAPTAPSSVTISGGGTICLNEAVSLTSNVSGGSNLFYQWQSNASGSYVDIPGANFSTYAPPTNKTGAISYRLRVASGSGCSGEVISAVQTITTTGISATTSVGTCGPAAVTLSAFATSGSVNWYSSESGGTLVFSGNSFTTPVLTTTTTYYVSTAGCATALRIPVTATINTSNGGIVNGGTTVTSGANSTVLTLSGYSGNILKWQSSTDNFSSVINNINNTTTTLEIVNLTVTSQYRAFVQNSSCAAAVSNVATINVQAAVTLPAKFIQLKTLAEAKQVSIEWMVQEINLARFEIEKSVDGKTFTKVGDIHSVGESGPNNYRWIDYHVNGLKTFYRVRAVDFDGSSHYSNIVTAAGAALDDSFKLYPNPLQGTLLTVQLNETAGDYCIILCTTLGVKIRSIGFRNTGGNGFATINTGKLHRGMHIVLVTGKDNVVIGRQLLYVNY